MKGRVAGYDVATQGLGQNGWATYSVGSAILAEFVGTLIFTLVILAVTGPKGTPMAGLVIGLTLMVIHFAFIPVSGSSFNAARSPWPRDLRRRHSAGAGLAIPAGADYRRGDCRLDREIEDARHLAKTEHGSPGLAGARPGFFVSAWRVA
jgi:hypothetical protein